VLDRLKQFKLYAKHFKCVFLVQSVEFLDYIVNSKDIVINSLRIKLIRTWFRLITLRELQVFLEFANFYRRFVKYFAKIIKFLIKLLKSSKQKKQNELFIFDVLTLVAFKALINIFIIALILVHFDFKNRIIIEIDALEFVIAIILF